MIPKSCCNSSSQPRVPRDPVGQAVVDQEAVALGVVGMARVEAARALDFMQVMARQSPARMVPAGVDLPWEVASVRLAGLVDRRVAVLALGTSLGEAAEVPGWIRTPEAFGLTKKGRPVRARSQALARAGSVVACRWELRRIFRLADRAAMVDPARVTRVPGTLLVGAGAAPRWIPMLAVFG
jgi:hypothetical protein